MRSLTPYYRGQLAYKAGKCYKDNPFITGSPRWQQWVNGFGDASDRDFVLLIRQYPQLLEDKSEGIILRS